MGGCKTANTREWKRRIHPGVIWSRWEPSRVLLNLFYMLPRDVATIVIIKWRFCLEQSDLSSSSNEEEKTLEFIWEQQLSISNEHKQRQGCFSLYKRWKSIRKDHWKKFWIPGLILTCSRPGLKHQVVFTVLLSYCTIEGKIFPLPHNQKLHS